jgi:hypothetical protein
MKKFATFIGTLSLIVIALVAGSAAFPAGAADHLDAPAVKTDGSIDINDVYIFHPGPAGSQDLDRTTLVMTVNPGAGAISGTDFNPKARYKFLIDQNGDAKPDIILRTQFGQPGSNGQQRLVVRWIEGDDEETIAQGWTEEVIEDDDVRVFAGLRDDPFFFDLANFNNGATFCGVEGGLPVSNFFAGLDVSALVIEVPTAWFKADEVGVWGQTKKPGGVVDRMGRPAINTVFIPSNPFEPDEASQEDAFNFNKPHLDQKKFRGEVVDTLTLLYSLNDSAGDDPSDDAATVEALADILLPDLLTVNLTQETAFLNGRGLPDDVIDAELGLITEGLISTDCIANDSIFLEAFPYLGEPND